METAEDTNFTHERQLIFSHVEYNLFIHVFKHVKYSFFQYENDKIAKLNESQY